MPQVSPMGAACSRIRTELSCRARSCPPRHGRARDADLTRRNVPFAGRMLFTSRGCCGRLPSTTIRRGGNGGSRHRRLVRPEIELVATMRWMQVGASGSQATTSGIAIAGSGRAKPQARNDRRVAARGVRSDQGVRHGDRERGRMEGPYPARGESRCRRPGNGSGASTHPTRRGSCGGIRPTIPRRCFFGTRTPGIRLRVIRTSRGRSPSPGLSSPVRPVARSVRARRRSRARTPPCRAPP